MPIDKFDRENYENYNGINIASYLCQLFDKTGFA